MLPFVVCPLCSMITMSVMYGQLLAAHAGAEIMPTRTEIYSNVSYLSSNVVVEIDNYIRQGE